MSTVELIAEARRMVKAEQAKSPFDWTGTGAPSDVITRLADALEAATNGSVVEYGQQWIAESNRFRDTGEIIREHESYDASKWYPHLWRRMQRTVSSTEWLPVGGTE